MRSNVIRNIVSNTDLILSWLWSHRLAIAVIAAVSYGYLTGYFGPSYEYWHG